jgi:hypothetical protein
MRHLTGLLALSFLLTACGGDDEPEGPSPAPTPTPDAGAGADAPPPAPPQEVTLAQLHAEVFLPSCAGAGCHIGAANSWGIDLTDDEGLLDRLLSPAQGADLPQVTPGDLANSYLWLKCQDEHRTVGGGGSRMPLGSSLTEAQTSTLRDWILGGALP